MAMDSLIIALPSQMILDIRRMVAIKIPFQGVLGDVPVYGFELSFASNNMIVVIALPEGSAGGSKGSVDLLGGLVFVVGHNLTKRGHAFPFGINIE